MNKAYTRIVWENYPSTGTPLNESNLNRMDSALDIIDDRVVSMDTTKLDKNTAYTMVKSITFNEDTGIFTITYLNGSTSTLDTKLEKLAVNFGFDAESEKLTITLEDGTVQEVDLSALISKYNFEDSATIGFTVGNDGNVVAIVKEGSIEGKHLEPNYLANVTAQAENASASASNAAISEMNAAASAEAAEAAAERAESVSSVSIATTEKPGIVKPDGTTITVDADGSISVGEAITKEIDSVKDDLKNYLPLTGGTLSGNLNIANGVGHLGATSGLSYLQSRPDINENNNKREFILFNATGSGASDVKNALELRDKVSGTTIGYKLFGEHNKPSGTYTGNGSETARTINVGSIGRFILIHDVNWITIVTESGGVGFNPNATNGAIAYIPSSKIKFKADGRLIIASNNASVNANGVTFTYNVV